MAAGLSRFPRYIIKTENVFSVIREINEILSLTNEPDKLVNTALDTLAQILAIECCWIQTIGDRKKQKLTLAAERGFTEAMKAEITAMDLTHEFTGQIIGMGHKITIPDLSNDGRYGLESFGKAGYKWAAAVPLMTYRCWGLLGTASKSRKLLKKDTPELIMVIGGLIAHAWSKSQMTGGAVRRGNLPDLLTLKPGNPAAVPADTRTDIAPVTPAARTTKDNCSDKLPEIPQEILPPEEPVQNIHEAPHARKPQSKRIDPAFHSHTRKMENFRKTHK